MELVDFIIEAKRNTYAAGRGETTPSRPGTKDLAYEQAGYRYLDSYVGGRRFSGQEIVYQAGKPVWSMNYYGFFVTDQAPDGFTDMLHRSLLRVERTAPFRGPARYENGPFRFECAHRGDVDRFTGEEKIFFEDGEIYRLYFHGGGIA